MISSYKWVVTHCCGEKDQPPISQTEIIQLAAEAKNPFLFIVHALRFQRLYKSRQFADVADIPISMDASSSAYQIISFFLLDKDIAQRTNLLGGGDGDTIHDLYSSLISPLSSYLKENLDEPLGKLVAESLTRKLIKIAQHFFNFKMEGDISNSGYFRHQSNRSRRYHIKTKLFVVCLFDLNDLPT